MTISMTVTSLQTLTQQYKNILHAEQAAEHTQLKHYQDTLLDLSQQYAQTPTRPPKPLTIPAIFGRSHHENFISDYLAYLLNPTKNGIGTGPVAQLLTLCGLEPTDVPLDEVIIHREYTVGNGRIDLLLEWEETLVVGIENKIYATEGQGQTQSYAREIQRLFKDTPCCHFIYLTRGGHKAKSKDFQPISYKDLIEAFQQVPISINTGTRQLVLWNDFLEHVKEYIIMADPDHFNFSEKSKLYIEHRSMLRDLEKTFKNEWAAAIGYLEGKVYGHLDGGPWSTHFNRTRHHWHQILKPTWNLSKLSVHHEYWFSDSSLKSQDISFKIDVERKQANDFLTRFAQRYPSLEPEYQRKDILYRPPNRKHALAYKRYPISQDIDQIAQVFIDAFAEFRFLEPEIDAVLAEMSQD